MSVNGQNRTALVEPRTSLADLLRDHLGLTGTHVGCEQGVCGTCTVLLDGQPVRSCLVLAVQADDARVETVESMGAVGRLHPLQEALAKHRGLQCGFCTPGVLMSALFLLRREPRPTPAEVRDEMSGHLCRCTGYEGILQAVSEVVSA